MSKKPFTQFALLVLFSERKIDLSEREFDYAWDQVIALLEAANNEKHRLTPLAWPPEEGQA